MRNKAQNIEIERDKPNDELVTGKNKEKTPHARGNFQGAIPAKRAQTTKSKDGARVVWRRPGRKTVHVKSYKNTSRTKNVLYDARLHATSVMCHGVPM